MNFKITSKLFISFFVLLFCSSFAQEIDGSKIVFGKKYTVEDLKRMNGIIRCASTEYEAMLQKKYPKRMTNEQFEDWIAPLIKNAQNNKSQNGGLITIPVVVHVIHSGQALGTAPNITDNQVKSQITVMNNDYRKMAGTPGYNTNPVGADVMIQFALAKVDPSGNPTDGIDRVNLCQTSWSMAAVDSYVKPVTIWDPTKYMNMWSIKLAESGILGYAQFPSNSGLGGLDPYMGAADTDGVVANYWTFGSSDYNDGTFFLNAPYDKGRTMTHEVGHYLGLRHIWGDGSCGNDYCTDTPTAHDANYGCPPSQPSCDSPSIFEMVQNYMDYTDDTCMNIFTINQKDRIMAVMNNSPRRMELKTSVAEQAIPLFANDAELKGEKSCSQASCGSPSNITANFILYNRGTSPLTSVAISYTVNGSAAQVYNWTGNLAQDKYVVISIPTGASQGTINAQITSANSGADQRAGNNTASVVIGNSIPVTNTNFTFQLQCDEYGNQVTWNLKNSAGTILYSGGPYTNTYPNIPNPVNQNWTLPQNDCYTFTINDSNNNGIYNRGGSYRILDASGMVVVTGNNYTSSQQRTFKVIPAQILATNEVKKETISLYPNPASDVLNITKVSNKASFEIYNAVGQLVKAGTINNNQLRIADLVKGTYIITIKDKNTSESIKFIKK